MSAWTGRRRVASDDRNPVSPEDLPLGLTVHAVKATTDEEHIDQCPEAEAAQGEEHRDALADVADVEAVRTDDTEEEPEGVSNPL
jgi:hypothetical protein